MPLTAAHRRPDVPWIVALVLLAVTVTVLGVLRGPSLSGLDEHTHLDYAWKLAQGEVPRAGSVLSPEILQEWACRGQDNLPDGELPACGSGAAPGDFPVAGENYNGWHPPLYYAITAALGSVGSWLPLGLTFTAAARLSGALWLAAGMLALYGVARMWPVPRWLAAATATLAAGVPLVAHASSTVTNDAPALLTGAGAAWVLSRALVHGRTGWLAPTVVALLAASTKLMSSVAILTVVGVLALTAVVPLRERAYRRVVDLVLPAIGAVTAVGAVALGWGAYQDSRTPADWANPIQSVNTAPVMGLPLQEWAPTLMDAFGLVHNYYLQPSLRSLAITAMVAALALLLTSAPLTGLAALERGDPARVTAWATLVGLLAVPLLVQGQELLRAGHYFTTVAPRYGVTLVPLALLLLALVAERRRVPPAVVVTVPAAAVLAVVLSFGGVL